MLFVIPVSRADVHLIKGLTDVMILLGGLQRHSVLFAPAPSVLQQASEEAIRLRGVCERVTVEAVAREPQGDWPLACNIQFRDVVELLDLRGINEPWFFMEADCTPRFAGYPDRLELEYRKRGMPFMGVLRKTGDVAKKQDGSPLDNSQYMVGAGIYPPNFKEYSCLYKATGQHAGKDIKPLPFDVRIRHEVGPKCWHTDLIAHHRSTGNYRMENGKLVCDDYNRQEGNASYAGEISEMAFIVHGCKDGSLAKLVLSGMQETFSGTAELWQRQPSQTPLAPAPEDPEMLFMRLCDILRIPADQVSDKWEALISSKTTAQEEMPADAAQAATVTRKAAGTSEEPSPAKDAPKATETPKTAPQETPEQDAEQDAELDKVLKKAAPSAEKLRKVVEDSITPIDVASAAADFGVTQKTIRELIESENSGMEISKGRWIVLVEVAQTT